MQTQTATFMNRILSRDQHIESLRALVAETPGSIEHKYAVEIEANGQTYVSQFADANSPGKAGQQAIQDYYSGTDSVDEITDVTIVGFCKERKPPMNVHFVTVAI